MPRLRFDSPPTALEWLKAVDEQPRIEWLIEGLLQYDTDILVTGKPKLSQKTFLVMFCSLLVAAGQSFGDLIVPCARRVLFLEQEGGMVQTADRLRRLANSLDLPHEKVFANLFFWHRPQWYLDEDADVARMTQFIEKNDISLVVLDTFARSFRGDENSSQDVGRALRGIQSFRRTGASVILVHHTRKEQQVDTGGGIDPDADIRGTSALPGYYEQHLALRFYTPGNLTDMLLMSKDDETKAYGIKWVFDNEQKRIYPKLLPREVSSVGAISSEVRAQFEGMLEPPVQYSTQMLQSVWNLSQNQTAKLIVDMIASGTLMPASYGRYKLA